MVETKKKERKISEKNMKRKNPFENLLENFSATFEIKVEKLKRRYEKDKINIEIETREKRGETVDLQKLNQHWE